MRGIRWQREVEWYEPEIATTGESSLTDYDRRRMRTVAWKDAVMALRRQLDGVTSPRERAIVLRHVLFVHRGMHPALLDRLLRDIGFTVDGRARPAPPPEGETYDENGKSATG